MKERRFTNQREFIRELKRYKKRDDFNNEYVMKFYDFSSIMNNSSYFVIRAFYQFYQLNLSRDIEQRIRSNKIYKNEEITELMYQMIEACYFLESK